MSTLTITTQHPALLPPELFEAYCHGWIDSISIDGHPVNMDEFRKAYELVKEIERLMPQRRHDEAAEKLIELRLRGVAQHRAIELDIELQNRRWEAKGEEI